VYAATEYPTVPDPVPLAPEVMVIHDTLLEDVQAQPAVVVTLTEPVDAFAETVVALGEMEKLQPALCVTVNVWPAIVSVPFRWLVVVLAATEYATEPLPAPDAPDVIVNHEALLAAVHAHPVTAETLTLPVEAWAFTEMLVGEIDELHGDENANVFDSILRPTPAGPTAATRASYVVPGAGHGVRRVVKSTRIFPSGCGAGLPSPTTCTGCVPPTR